MGGHDTLERINELAVDGDGKPLQNVRITRTIVLDDPFPDMPGLSEHLPDTSPEASVHTNDHIEDECKPNGNSKLQEEITTKTLRKEARNKAIVLEMFGDLPDAEVTPPNNALFVC